MVVVAGVQVSAHPLNIGGSMYLNFLIYKVSEIVIPVS